jgi:hypothetical protein
MLGSYFHVLTLKNNWIREGYQSSQSQLWQSVHAASKDRTVTVSCTSEPPWDWISWKLSGGTAQVLHACWAVRTAVAISLTMSTSTKYVPGVEWKTQERGSMLSKDRFSRTGFEDSPCPSFCMLLRPLILQSWAQIPGSHWLCFGKLLHYYNYSWFSRKPLNGTLTTRKR